MERRSVEASGSRRSVTRLARRQVIALAVASSVLLAVTAGALAVTGGLIQPAGTAGCVSENGSGPCANGHGLENPGSVAVSPDGKNVYVAAASSVSAGAVARLDRNPTTGAISQPVGIAGCVSEDGSGPCADGHGLIGGGSLAISPDGENVYVASPVRGTVVRLNRNPTSGALSEPVGKAGCISEYGLGGACADGHGMKRASSVAVSPDGKSVYVAADSSGGGKSGGSVARLNRNPTTGALSQPAGKAGCISEFGFGGTCVDGHALDSPVSVAVSPDGKSVYAASQDSSAVVRLKRNAATGAITQPAGTGGCVGLGGSCAPGHALDSPVSVAVSPDGKSVYAASSASFAVARLSRNTATGAITQPPGIAGCVSEFGGGSCADGHALSAPRSVAVSPDGKSVYVASEGYAPQGYPPSGHGVARLNRNPTTGAISQPVGIAGCVSEDGSGPCADGHGLIAPEAVAVSPDGKSVYAAAIGSNAVARFSRAP
jgi:DNA-binding beta-propeller fold protein YncE